MTSNYPHYVPLGSSLPNDYAIVSHFASYQDDSALEESETDDVQGEMDVSRSLTNSPRRVVRRINSRDSSVHSGGGYTNMLSTSPTRGRRLSVPRQAHGGSRKLSRGALTTKSRPWASEHDPLLSSEHPVSDPETASREPHEWESWQLWLQELKIIAKYTAPVFGSATSSSLFGHKTGC